jgi:hypothetical protein
MNSKSKNFKESWKGVNCQIMIKFQQNWFKQELKHYVLRSINLYLPYLRFVVYLCFCPDFHIKPSSDSNSNSLVEVKAIIISSHIFLSFLAVSSIQVLGIKFSAHSSFPSCVDCVHLCSLIWSLENIEYQYVYVHHVAAWLKHYTTSWKVAGSRSDEVIDFFQFT